MRWLALVRYRYLSHVRRAKWVLPVLLVSIAVPAISVTIGLVMPDDWFRRQIGTMLAVSALGVLFAYWMHVLILTMLCWSFGIIPRHPQSARPSDLMDTAPVSGQMRFWGDAAGIAAAVLAIHACTTPLLAYMIALSPFPTALFWYLELTIVAIVAFSSTTSSWTLRSETSRWGQTRAARSSALLGLLMTLVILATIRVESLGVALDTFFREPSVRSWSAIVQTVNSVPLLAFLTLLIMGSFVTYYAVRSARLIEES